MWNKLEIEIGYSEKKTNLVTRFWVIEFTIPSMFDLLGLTPAEKRVCLSKSTKDTQKDNFFVNQHVLVMQPLAESLQAFVVFCFSATAHNDIIE